jgi:hypothetical protein
MHGQDEDAKRAVVARFKGIAAEYNQNLKRAEGLQHEITLITQRQVELQAQANDCYAAARLFGFDLMQEYHRPVDQYLTHTPPSIEPPPASSAAVRARTIKDMVLEAAQLAYPNPVKASELRDQFAKQGIATHEKTIGMTLYRWLRKGKLRRDRWNWFFVPTDEQSGEDNPRDEPGFADEAS